MGDLTFNLEYKCVQNENTLRLFLNLDKVPCFDNQTNLVFQV